jgi:hypothetical protein
MKIISKKTTNKILDYFVVSEQDLAIEQLGIMAQKKARGEITKEKELTFMFSQGAYAACKKMAKILNIKYNFLY